MLKSPTQNAWQISVCRLNPSCPICLQKYLCAANQDFVCTYFFRHTLVLMAFLCARCSYRNPAQRGLPHSSPSALPQVQRSHGCAGSTGSPNGKPSGHRGLEVAGGQRGKSMGLYGRWWRGGASPMLSNSLLPSHLITEAQSALGWKGPSGCCADFASSPPSPSLCQSPNSNHTHKIRLLM